MRIHKQLLPEREGIMQQKDLEKFAFLYLCGQRDRNILSGGERMSFEDFDRLIYLTDYLGLGLLNLEIWNRFSARFKDRIEDAKQLVENNLQYLEYREYEDDTQFPEQWIMDFYAAVPDREAGKYLELQREGVPAYGVQSV